MTQIKMMPTNLFFSCKMRQPFGFFVVVAILPHDTTKFFDIEFKVLHRCEALLEYCCRSLPAE
jgi:hypothetical protein